jgi:hypothetical protein
MYFGNKYRYKRDVLIIVLLYRDTYIAVIKLGLLYRYLN